MSEESPKAVPAPNPLIPILIGLAGWAVPGLGHLLLGRWGRALVFFLGVSAFAVAGVALHGFIFTWKPGDAFEALGYLSNLGAGSFYFAATKLAHYVPDVSRAAGDYGTRFFATAGVLNLLCALDAFDIATGKKE